MSEALDEWWVELLDDEWSIWWWVEHLVNDEWSTCLMMSGGLDDHFSAISSCLPPAIVTSANHFSSILQLVIWQQTSNSQEETRTVSEASIVVMDGSSVDFVSPVFGCACLCWWWIAYWNLIGMGTKWCYESISGIFFKVPNSSFGCHIRIGIARQYTRYSGGDQTKQFGDQFGDQSTTWRSFDRADTVVWHARLRIS